MATNEQISEIEDTIVRAREIKDPTSKEARDLYNKAIRLADEYFKIERPKEGVGEPQYDPKKNEPGSGHGGLTLPVNKDGEGKAETTFGPDAFVNNGKPDARWLAACKVHEYAHAAVGVEIREFTPEETEALKKAKPSWTDEEIKKARPARFKLQDVNEEEVIAYNAMLKKAGELGLSPSDVEWIKKEKKRFYERMSEEKKKKYKVMEPWLGCHISETEFHEGLGSLIVPKGTTIDFERDHSWTLPHAMTLAELTYVRFDSNFRKLVELNPHLSVGIASLEMLLFGPSGLGGEARSVTSVPSIIVSPPMFLGDGSITRSPGAIETPCANGIVRVRHAYSECQGDGFWHIVEDDYVSCLFDCQNMKYRVFDMATTQSCRDGTAPPRPMGLAYKDLHGDSTCQSPKQIGDISISECVDGVWENATYVLYECLDGTRRVSLPAKHRQRTEVPCSSTPSPRGADSL